MCMKTRVVIQVERARTRWTVKSVRVTDEPRGRERINGVNGMSDIEGKATREAVSECGQRASFNWASAVWKSSTISAAMTSGSSAGRAPVAAASSTAGGTGILSVPREAGHTG